MSVEDEPITILHVDDEPGLAKVAAEFLKREDDRIVVDSAASASEGRNRMSENGYDCVVSDYDMPGQDGISFLETVRADRPDLPFILYTGKGSEEVASDAISAGVTDYLQKGGGTDQYAVLANRVRNAVEKHRAEQEAEQTRSRLEAIAKNSKDVIITIDPESRILFVNDSVGDLLGYPPADLLGKPLTSVMPARHRDSHIAAVDRYIATGERTIDWQGAEFEVLHRDGTEIPVSISFGEFEEDGERRFVGILRDITGRKEHERTLRREKERFELLVGEVGTHAIFMLDPEGHIVSWNEGAHNIKGYTRDEILGEHFSILYTETDVHDGLPDRLLAEATREGRVEDEGWRVRKDGTRFWAQVSITALFDDTGDLRGFGKVTRDDTDRKELEAELEDSLTQYRALVEQNLAGIYLLRDDGFEYVNPTFAQITGYTEAELVSMDPLDVVAPESRDEVATNIEKRLIGDVDEVDYSLTIMRKDGDRRDVRAHGSRIDLDGEPAILGTIVDTTDHGNHQ